MSALSMRLLDVCSMPARLGSGLSRDAENTSNPARLTTLTPGQVDRPLPVPVGHEPRDLEGLRAAERDAELARDGEPDDALPQRRRVAPRARATGQREAGLGVVGEILGDLLGEAVEGLGVFAQLLGGAGERLGDARAELALRARAAPRSRTRTRE